MKRYFKYLPALLFLVLPARAQQSETAPSAEAAPFTGIWQLFRPVKHADGSFGAQFQPTWKIYNADGSFFTFMWPPYEGRYGTFITNKGSYQLQNDSLYIERIGISTTNPANEGTLNRLDYHVFADGQFLTLSYGQNQEGKKIGETWQRVGPAQLKGAQGPKTETLVGLWQLCDAANGDGDGGSIAYYPVWKYLRADGSFITFVWKNVRNSALVSAYGTFTVDSDSSYTEKVALSEANPELQDQNNTMDFVMEGDTLMHVSYLLPGKERKGEETWRRIVPGMMPRSFTTGQRDSRGIYLYAEKAPRYPGGEQAMINFIRANFSYPNEAGNRNVVGQALVRVIVKKDGTVVNPTLLRSADPALDKECRRVVSLMKFTPATMNGAAVDCYYTIPMNFGTDIKNDRK